MTRNVQEVEAKRAMYATIDAWANIAGISKTRRAFIVDAIELSAGEPDYANPKMLAALDELKDL